MNPLPTLLGDDWILARRPPRNPVSADRPYAFLVEPEAGPDGVPIDVATIFLTNRECPFRCLMCDLWKNTFGVAGRAGQIPSRSVGTPLPRAQHLKLYNAGNFFDLAIPWTITRPSPACGGVSTRHRGIHPKLVGGCWGISAIVAAI